MSIFSDWRKMKSKMNDAAEDGQLHDQSEETGLLKDVWNAADSKDKNVIAKIMTGEKDKE